MLENKSIAFIGAGMMAEAIIRGLLRAGMEPNRIYASDPEVSRLDFLRKELGISVTKDNSSAAKSSDIIILAVKPFIVSKALDNIKDAVTSNKLLISIAAGITTASIQSRLASGIPVVRVMPNTPCLIGEGAIAIAPGEFASQDHMELAAQIFNATGKVAQITEDKIDAVTGLSGSGPGYVYTFIEALADGGVRVGLPRSTALLLAAQTVAGAAKMVLETGEHPAELRDKVITPQGTTIEGLAVLERAKFRAAVIDAVTAATNRAKEQGMSR